MDTQSQRQLIARIYEACEASDLDKAVMLCLRLARMLGDTFNVVMFLRELHPDVQQLKANIRDETRHLSQSAQSALWKATLERWIQERTVSHLPTDDDGRNVLAMGVAELKHDIAQMEKSIEDLRLPPGLGEYDTAAFTDQHVRLKGEMRLKVRACHEVLERIRTRCYHYASRVEGQLAAEVRTSDVVADVQREVHNFYAARCEPAFQSLSKAASLLGSANAEDHALLLTSIRRAVKAAADYHFPAQDTPVKLPDGSSRNLDDAHYLNRLHEFCRQGLDSTADELLRAELDLLAVFARRLNDVASKGVHAQVSPLEAKQGLLGVYVFLSNLIARRAMTATKG
jgi:hypothetical protein